MDNDKYKCFVKCNDDLNKLDESIINDLKIGEFIIDDDVNELKLIRYNMNKARYDTSSLSLTIAVTSDCNFRCTYCYEKDVINTKYLSSKAEEDIYKLIEDSSSHINHLSVTWYGGEPLLAIDIIERMSERIIDITTKKNINYFSNMITNGYLLNEKNCNTLKKSKICYIQVTIDGTEEIHNIRRPLANGKGTFKKIIKNLVDNFQILPDVSLRVNIDNSNLESGNKISQLINKLNIGEKVTPYLGRIVNDNNCLDETTTQGLSMEEFAREDFRYSLNNLKDSNMLFRYPKLIGNICGADRLASYVIDASGDLYKCWSDIGNKIKSVGNISKNLFLNKLYLDYMDYDPMEDDNCRVCNLLPTCMGGCPLRRINNKEDSCSIYKYMLEEYLNSFINFFKKQETNKVL